MSNSKAIAGSTVFLSAFLLFSVEPLIAKKILPWFGGSAAVWSVCLVFFQAVLLLGYIYARFLAWMPPARQPLVHGAVLALSLSALPLGPRASWQAGALAHPTWSVLALLSASVGLPFFALSSTSPLLQSWSSRDGSKNPYRLFALSNLASLAALLTYPFLIEPSLNLNIQSVSWSCGYGLFILLCAAVAWRSRKDRDRREAIAVVSQQPAWSSILIWFALAACGSMLLLSITNHISENVAAVPLLWVLPLATYLLTFVLTFDSARLYNRPLFLRLLAMALGVMAYALYDIRFVEILQVALPVFLVGLFSCCMFCHGELHRLRPEREHLTSFYVAISAGGAAGAIFVGLIAPQIFTGIYELPVALILTAGLALALTWKPAAPIEAGALWMQRLLWMAVSAAMMVVFQANVSQYGKDTLFMQRSFYGALRVVQSPHAGLRQTRTLFHGAITHGAQFVLPPMRFRPTTYYGPDSGIGIVLRECFPAPKRVGIVGLGVGTLAAYGQPGDTFRFYEINPQVVDAAESLFTYLRETPAKVEIAVGDARVSLQQDKTPPFDVLAVDAFSGDAIPVHLLTIEAMRLYRAHLKPDGALAFHISNDYLDLAPVVRDLAQAVGYRAIVVHSHSDEDSMILPADWVLVTNNPEVLNNSAVQMRAERIVPRSGLRLWTDNFNNLFQVLKQPSSR